MLIFDICAAPPFGLPSVTELLKVLLSLLDPQAQQQLSRAHTDSLLIPSLTTLNVIFSTSGPTIARVPTLRALVLDTGCKCLFQLARSDNPTVLSLALRTIATIFETMRPHLKLQQELLLSFLIDKLTPPPGTGGNGRTALGIAPKRSQTGASSTASTSDLAERGKDGGEDDGEDGGGGSSSRPTSRTGSRAGVAPARGETRELMLETLGHLSRYPEFMVDVWVNYDCDINCEDVFERLIGFLVKVSGFGTRSVGGAWLTCGIEFRVCNRQTHSRRAPRFCVWTSSFRSSLTWQRALTKLVLSSIHLLIRTDHFAGIIALADSKLLCVISAYRMHVQQTE